MAPRNPSALWKSGISHWSWELWKSLQITIKLIVICLQNLNARNHRVVCDTFWNSLLSITDHCVHVGFAEAISPFPTRFQSRAVQLAYFRQTSFFVKEPNFVHRLRVWRRWLFIYLFVSFFWNIPFCCLFVHDHFLPSSYLHHFYSIWIEYHFHPRCD